MTAKEAQEDRIKYLRESQREADAYANQWNYTTQMIYEKTYRNVTDRKSGLIFPPFLWLAGIILGTILSFILYI